MRLEAINLNLLLALDALLAERSVSRAAARMGVSQSAMSHSLRQLREILADPVLVRSGHEMLPTPRALALAPELRSGLEVLRSVVEGEVGFRPDRLERDFRIATHDGAAGILVASVIARVQREAPGVRLTLVAPERGLGEALADGRLDLALLPPIDPPSGVETRPVLATDWAVLFRRDHPAIGAQLDLDTYCAVPHALMTLTGHGRGLADVVLDRLGRERRVVLRFAYLNALPPVLVASDLLATVPRGAATLFAEVWPLRWLPPPPELVLPDAPMLLTWHRRNEAEPAHRWLRELVLEELQAFGTDGRALLERR